MTTEELKRILELHAKLLNGEPDGVRANLIRANLIRANLRDANLIRANLSGANLIRANLSGANLIRANLGDANLGDANLSGANLSDANLIRANLSDANLIRANLSGANLSGANLSGANLSGAKYSILSGFKINFGELSDNLTLELMRHDAEFCGVEKMTSWANGGPCPYTQMSRDFIFRERRTLWVPGAPQLRGMELWKALAKECNIKISDNL
jgi:hypothetical protein